LEIKFLEANIYCQYQISSKQDLSEELTMAKYEEANV